MVTCPRNCMAPLRVESSRRVEVIGGRGEGEGEEGYARTVVNLLGNISRRRRLAATRWMRARARAETPVIRHRLRPSSARRDGIITVGKVGFVVRPERTLTGNANNNTRLRERNLNLESLRTNAPERHVAQLLRERERAPRRVPLRWTLGNSALMMNGAGNITSLILIR